jgi:F-type H+-transporting ATPase subunit epsilon
MADRAFTVDIVTPDRVVLSDRAVYLRAPGVCGSFGVLANHAPFLTELSIGELTYRRESGQEIRLALNGGFLQVFENQVTVLADSAERAEEIDVERARLARERYLQDVRALAGSYSDDRHAVAEAGVERAKNRIRVAGPGGP